MTNSATQLPDTAAGAAVHAREILARLAGATEALGALAAACELRAGDSRAHPAVEHALEEVLRAAGLADPLPALDRRGLEALRGLARTRLLQAVELAEDPARAPGWQHTDPAILQSQGAGSAAFAAICRDAVAPLLPGLLERLNGPGGATLLDVGVGVGALMIAMCRTWPELRAVGIDVWEPALALARRGVAAASLEPRIELRRQSVAALSDRDAYDLVWLPVSFIDLDVLTAALPCVLAAMRPGGWLIANSFAGPDELSAALARLRAARAGGAILDRPQLQALLERAGFEDVRSLAPEILPPVSMTVGRRGEDV